MPDEPRSLFRSYPRNVEVPIGLAVCLGLIITGLTLPVMSISKLIFWEDRCSIIQGAASMWRAGHYVLAVVLFAFSVVLPNAKLAALGIVWFTPMRPGPLRRTVWWTKALGKWSMLDVFVVAVTIVLSQSKALFDASPRIGLYFFAAGVLASLVLSMWMDHLAERGLSSSEKA